MGKVAYTNTVQLIRAVSSDHWKEAKGLVEQYAASLDFDLDFQDFDKEIEALHDEYRSPQGCFLLAKIGVRFVGCVALRCLGDDLCEMKRLYVLQDVRGRGIGRMLAAAIIGEGRKLGYKRMRLDTVPSMQAAEALYTALGFRAIDPYRYNPIPGATFMELALDSKQKPSN